MNFKTEIILHKYTDLLKEHTTEELVRDILNKSIRFKDENLLYSRNNEDQNGPDLKGKNINIEVKRFLDQNTAKRISANSDYSSFYSVDSSFDSSVYLNIIKGENIESLDPAWQRFKEKQIIPKIKKSAMVFLMLTPALHFQKSFAIPGITVTTPVRSYLKSIIHENDFPAYILEPTIENVFMLTGINVSHYEIIDYPEFFNTYMRTIKVE